MSGEVFTSELVEFLAGFCKRHDIRTLVCGMVKANGSEPSSEFVVGSGGFAEQMGLGEMIKARASVNFSSRADEASVSDNSPSNVIKLKN